jgi:hypothetical protein
MSSSELPEAACSAIASGDLAQLQHLYGSNLSLEEIARQAAQDKQPETLEWCYTQGWTHPAESFNNKFFILATDAGIPIFQVLVNHGWNLNAHYTEACGDALACAIRSGEYDFTKWLLEHGHDPTPSEGMHGPSVVSTTVQGDTASMDILKLLLNHGTDVDGCGVGIAAAEEGNLEALQVLIEHGINPEERDRSWAAFDDEPYDSEATALYHACRQGKLECVKLLLDRGADAQARNGEGTSCVAVAKKRGHQDVVELLEARGVTD